jgi:hypothetical protein
MVMNQSGDVELLPLFPYLEMRKGTIGFHKKIYDHHYSEIGKKLPQGESILYAMPAYRPDYEGGAGHGCIALTEERIIFSGGSTLFSAMGGEDIFDREYKFIETFRVFEKENPYFFSLIILRTKEFKPLSTTTADSFQLAYQFGEDAVKFTQNAEILRKRHLNK